MRGHIVPYRECPHCGLRLYSAARWSTYDRCPRCDSALEAPLRPHSRNGFGPELRRRFPPEASAPKGARRALEALSGRIDAGSLATGLLLVSELVTNSVVHGPDGRSTIELRAWTTGRRLRIEVADQGPGIEARASDPSHDDEWHWGLHLVDSLADHWGTESDPEAIVWFELDGARVAGRAGAAAGTGAGVAAAVGAEGGRGTEA